MGQQTLTDETAMRQSSGESTATGLASEVSERTEVYNQRGEKRTSGDINDIDEEADEEEEDDVVVGLESHAAWTPNPYIETTDKLGRNKSDILDRMPMMRRKGLEAMRKARQSQQAFWHQMGSPIQDQVDGGLNIHARHHWWIVEPNCSFRKIWDIIQALMLFYVAVVVPVRVGFEIPVYGTAYIFDLAVDCYWYADLILNFVTAYEEEVRHGDDVHQRIVYDPAHIARHYLRTWFVFDLLAQMPVDTILRGADGTFECSLRKGGCDRTANTQPSLFRLFKLLRLARLVKLLRLIRITRLLERYQDDFFKYLPLIAILKLFVGLMFIGHVVGSFFFFFSQPEWMSSTEIRMFTSSAPPAPIPLSPPGLADVGAARRLFADIPMGPSQSQAYSEDSALRENWIQKQRLDSPEATIVEKYVASMYWAFTTLATVGYGDISATTVAERIYAIFAQIVGGFVFSGIIGSITTVVANLDRSKSAHREKLEMISAYITDRDLPKELRKSVLAFFRKQASHEWEERDILQELPRNLRICVLEHEYLELLSHVSLLTGGSRDLYRALCARIMPHTYHDGSTVFNAGDPALDVMLVVRGEVHVTEREFNTVHTVLGPGALFGEESMFGGIERIVSVRSSMQTTLLAVKGTDLDGLLQGYPEIVEQIRSAYERRLVALRLHVDILKESPQVRLPFVSGSHRPLVRVHNTDSPHAGRGNASFDDRASAFSSREKRHSASERRMTQLAEEITHAWDADDEISYSQDATLLRSVNRDLVRERVGRVHPMVWDTEGGGSRGGGGCSCKAELDDLRTSVKVLESAVDEILAHQLEAREQSDRLNSDLRGLLLEALSDRGFMQERQSSQGPHSHGGSGLDPHNGGGMSTGLMSEGDPLDFEPPGGGPHAAALRTAAQLPALRMQHTASALQASELHLPHLQTHRHAAAHPQYGRSETYNTALVRFSQWEGGTGVDRNNGAGVAQWATAGAQQFAGGFSSSAADASVGAPGGGGRAVWYEQEGEGEHNPRHGAGRGGDAPSSSDELERPPAAHLRMAAVPADNWDEREGVAMPVPSDGSRRW